jgi:hypothetical protein
MSLVFRSKDDASKGKLAVRQSRVWISKVSGWSPVFAKLHLTALTFEHAQPPVYS